MIRSREQFYDHCYDNVESLFVAGTEEIYWLAIRYLEPKIPDTIHDEIMEQALSYWEDRKRYALPDEDGYPRAKANVRPVLENAVNNIFTAFRDYEVIFRDWDGEEIEECEECRRLHYAHEIHEHDGLCQSCYDNVYRECKICRERRHYNEMTTIVRYKVGERNEQVQLCYDCLKKDEQFTRCATCRRTVFTENLITVPLNEDTEITCCPNCSRNVIRTCNCGTKFAMANRHDGYNNEGVLCDACLFKEGYYQTHVYKPSAIHFHTVSTEKQQPDTMFFGLELECELGDRSRKHVFARKITKMYTHRDMYLVHDGSLDHGIEVVLMPFSEAWYKLNKAWLSQLYRDMYNLGGRFDKPKVGLHIHTSKAAWSPSQLYKLMRFCYDPDNEYTLERFYGRGQCRHSTKDYNEYERAAKVAKDGKNADDSHHYNMINMSTGTTVEFRMFSGTKDVNKVFAYIDYTRALHEFTAKYGLMSMTLGNFGRLIQDSLKYKSLRPYFTEVS